VWESSGQDGSGRGVYGQRFAFDGTGPRLLGIAHQYLTAPHRFSLQFNEDVSATLGSADLVLENLTTGETIPSDRLTLTSYASNTATFEYLDQVLPDGRYRLTVLAAGVRDPANNPLDGNGDGTGGDNYINDTAIYFLRGDANHDGIVNLADFNILAQNFGQSPRNFSEGDFNYDGVVNLADFNILAQRFGIVLPLARASALGQAQGDPIDQPLDELA
jgi:hypothetical protein